jgi:predicted ATPase/class 3 adenylate cyclase
MLPSGTITFLFTDIESSTKLWEQYPDQMGKSLPVQETILREEIARHGGHVFKTVGDGVYAVFGDTLSAVSAAGDAQQRLVETSWETPGGLRVRMALHTGTAQLQGGDYFGPALNRIARILSAGHGGQVLVSEATRTLVERDLPKGSSLRDQGLHRLKDLAQPEHIFQLVTPGLPDDFPQLRSLDAFPNNLPRQLTSFVGREREMMDVKNLLSTSPLLTLTGSSGSGKTRLALQVGAELVETFRDGVWLVALEVVSDQLMVPRAIASAVGVHEDLSFVARPLSDVLVDSLKEKSLLLIVDNCEHVLSASAEIATLLLRSCPDVRILATSQERLGVGGERVYQVSSLSIPSPQQPPTAERLAQYEAVRLFTERAALSQPRFTLTAGNAPAVAQVVQQLEGIPLAIELAAARVKVMSVDQIAARLNERFRLLTVGPRTDAPRHQTLRAALDWSYDLLSEAEQGLLRRLAVFAGSFDLEAVEAICGDQAGADILDLLSRLVEKSLVMFDEQDATARYRLLETVRLYGQEMLTAAGEEPAVRARHRDWYLIMAERAEPALAGPEQKDWLDRLELEHDNFRAALRWSLSGDDETGPLLRLAGALWRFWEIRGHWIEGRKWLETTLAKTAGVEGPSRIKVLSGAANLAFDQGDFPRAHALGEGTLALSQKVGDKQGTVVCLNLLGLEACSIENFGRARELGAESLRLSQELGDTMGIAGGLAILGLVARGEGDTTKAIEQLTQSLQHFRALGDRLRSSLVLLNLGLVVREQGDLNQARVLFEESLDLFKTLGDRWGVAFSQSNLGILAWTQHEHERAADLYKESLVLRRELKDKRGIATSLVGLAAVATRQEHFERAATLFGAAEALRESIEVALPPFIRGEYDNLIASVRSKLPSAIYEKARSRGRALDQDQAIDYALKDTSVAIG